MNEEKELEHYFLNNAIDKFGEVVFVNCFYDYDMSSDEMVIVEKIPMGTKIDNKTGEEKEIFDKRDYKGYCIKDHKSKKMFFLESEFVQDLPIKIKGTKEVIYKNKVYHVITEYSKAKMEHDDILSPQEWFDVWFDLPHSNPLHLKIMKLATITSFLDRAYFRISTNRSFGKTGVVASLLTLTGEGMKIDKDTSPAKLTTGLNHDFTHYDETGGLSTEFTRTLGNIFFGTADGTSNIYEHNTTGSHLTKSKYNISNYGYIITHNPPESYLEKGLEPFEQQFRIEVFDRIPVLELSGKLETSKIDIPNVNWYKYIKDNIAFYRQFIGKILSMRDKRNEIVLTKDFNWDFKYSSGASDRHNNWMRVFAKYTEFFCPDEYEIIMNETHRLYKEYIQKLKDLGLLLEE